MVSGEVGSDGVDVDRDVIGGKVVIEPIVSTKR